MNESLYLYLFLYLFLGSLPSLCWFFPVLMSGFVLSFYLILSLNVSLFSKEKWKGVIHDGRVCGEKLGGVCEGETVIKIY